MDDQTRELLTLNHQLAAEIENRKRAELAAAQRALELSALHTATAALLTTLDLEKLLGQILDSAIIAIPAGEKGMLHMIAPETGQLEMRAIIGYSDPRIQRVSFPGSRSYVATSVSERTAMLIHNTQSDPTLRYEGRIPEIRSIQSVIVAPLILDEQVIGAISLESSHLQAFTEDNLNLLVSFAATATAAIRNAQLHQEMQRQAITDSLTNVYNRRGVSELGRREIERAKRFNRPLAAIMIDLDSFKAINDLFGHHAGDVVLRTIAERIYRNIREVDILGRLGGDEFIILLSETDLFTAANLAERLRRIIAEKPIVVDGETNIPVTISMGIAKANPATADLTALIHDADQALYQAKQSGRNRVQVGKDAG